MVFNKFRFKYNKNEPIGNMCICPICGNRFRKRVWNQIFDKHECARKYQSIKEEAVYETILNRIINNGLDTL